MSQATPVDILVMGAGSIGCFVGGKLASQRLRVLFVGRPRMLDAVARHGITLTDLDGSKVHVAPNSDMLADHVPPGVSCTLRRPWPSAPVTSSSSRPSTLRPIEPSCDGGR